MATVTRENIGTLHDKLTVKLAKEDYLPSFEKSLKQYAKVANVPGFRKGMVPAGMVRKMYGQGLFQEEVLKSAGRELENYINGEKMGIFGQPMIMPSDKPLMLDLSAPGEAEFAFEIGLKPDINIPALEGSQPLTRYKVAVSEQLINDEMQRIARRYGKVEDRTEVATKDDIIYATYQPCDADGNAIEGAEKKEDTVLLEKLPVKLQEMLMGKEAGAELTIRPSEVATAEELPAFLKDQLKVEMPAADFLFLMTITKVGMIIPRDLDIMLFAEVFPNDNIADESAFRDRIRMELQREYDRISATRLNDEIFELLVHSTPVTLPTPFLKRWMREGGEKQLSEAQVEKEYPGFDHQMRWTLISDKIMIDNNINVSLEEVKEDIKGRVLSYFGMDLESGDETPWMNDYIEKMLKDEKAVNDTYRRLLMDKLFLFLQTKFSIAEQELTEEEFFRLPSAHAAHHHGH